MSVILSQINTEQYFGTWLERTNQLIEVLYTNTVTTSLTARGGFTQGNAYVNGVFAAVLLAANSAHGGNNTSWSNLDISSNVYITNTMGFPTLLYQGNSTGNVMIGFTNTNITNSIFATINSTANYNSYLQIIHRNKNPSTEASTDFILNSDAATETTKYLDIGINSSGYTNSLYSINGPLDGYMYTANSGLAIGTADAYPLQFFTNGTLATSEAMRIDSGSNVGIGNTNPNARLQVTGTANVTNLATFSNSVIVYGNTTIGVNANVAVRVWVGYILTPARCKSVTLMITPI